MRHHIIPSVMALLCTALTGPCFGQVRRPLWPLREQATPRQAEFRAMRARQILESYLKDGLTHPYEATQVTQVFSPTPLRSAQLIKSDGPGRLRIEYLSPPEIRGEVILVQGGKLIRYAPLAKGGQVGETTAAEDPSASAAQLVRSVRAGLVTVSLGPMRAIAGRPSRAIVVGTGPGAPARRLWIDPITGIRMRQENWGASGGLISASSLTDIDLSPVFAPRDFEPISPANLGRPDRYPARGVFPSIAEAQALVAFTIRVPRVPDGYRLTGAWVTVLRARRQVALRYRSGVTTFVLLQHPIPATGPMPRAFGPGRRVVRIDGTVQWLADGRLFTLSARIPQQDIDQIVSSLQ